MKKHILSIALFAAFSANATCGFRGIPNEVCPDTPQATPTAATTAQAQASAQAAANAAASAGAVSGGGAANAGGGSASQRQAQRAQANGNGAGSGIVTIQGAQAGSGDRLLVLPNVPPIAPTVVPGATMSTTIIACGPLLAVWREPITAHYAGIVSHDERQQGWTYGVGPAVDYGGEDFRRAPDGRLYGHSAVITYAVPTTGYARQLVIGGGSSSGAWGQGGAGGSGANQQLVKDITVLPCQVPAAPPQELGQREWTHGKTEVRKVVVRKRINPQPLCVLEDKTVKVCKRT